MHSAIVHLHVLSPRGHAAAGRQLAYRARRIVRRPGDEARWRSWMEQAGAVTRSGLRRTRWRVAAASLLQRGAEAQLHRR